MITGPWTDVESVKSCCANLALDEIDARIQEAVDVASELMYWLSGMQWAGEHVDTVRPADNSICMSRSAGDLSLSESAYASAMMTCSCKPIGRLDLGHAPVTEVQEVKVDGAVLDPDEYTIVGQRYLQRMAGPAPLYSNDGWPRHQHLDRPLTEPGTWSVKFKHGTPPPVSGMRAADVLACELVKAFARSEDCQLPGRVTTLNRQGVSMTLIDPNMLSSGKTGVYEADLFLTAVNPKGLRGGALVWSPDLEPAPW